MTTTIAAGKLNYSIEIQRATTSTDDAGSPVKTWSKLAVVKAELVERSSRDERLPGFGQLTREALLLRIRWLDGLTLSDRVVFSGERFLITKLAEIGVRRGLEITAERACK